MFINDVNKKEEIRNIVIQDLKRLGIKYRCKKPRQQHVQETRGRRVFKTPLHSLISETVTLASGQQLVVPKIVHELCSYIVIKIDTEGLFRKGGSKARQNEMRLSLDAGCYLGDEHHEIDVANVLKTFFRELPEPLIPYYQHELFLRCMMLEQNQTEAVLLSCLLLPTEHLNTLAYFMQFLLHVAEYRNFNKMDSYNLAVVMGPTLFPAEEKLTQIATQRLTKSCELFKLLIENAVDIGSLSEGIIERVELACFSSSVNSGQQCAGWKKKKKRRSGSLTRMFNGLKKIVSSKSEDVSLAGTPDLLQTPAARSGTKRKMDGSGLSRKKRKEIINRLPQNAVLNSPYAPARTPISVHPNAIKSKSPDQRRSYKEDGVKEKRLLWPNKIKVHKKELEETTVCTNSIQRRWSAVSAAAAGFRKKKKRNSVAVTLTTEDTKVSEKDPQIDNKINVLSEQLTVLNKADLVEPNYVRISKTEYEEIKSRVFAIERRISVELDNAVLMDDPEVGSKHGVKNVEMAYEQTLVQAEPLSSTTDQLAKRLSRELKIRKSSEGSVFRSPSARKIGNIRRRSKDENQVHLSRNQTWCASAEIPHGTLKKVRKAKAVIPDLGTMQSSPATRNMSASQLLADSSNSWRSADGVLVTPEEAVAHLENGRTSLAKLRSRNAGMVLAKARLFDNLMDSDCSASDKISKTTLTPPAKPNKIGATRNLDNRQSYRWRALKTDDRRIGKKSVTPKNRPVRSPKNIRGQNAQLWQNTKDPVQPAISKSVPQIKKKLNTKSPRRMCRTPFSTDSKQIPVKAMIPAGQQTFLLN